MATFLSSSSPLATIQCNGPKITSTIFPSNNTLRAHHCKCHHLYIMRVRGILIDWLISHRIWFLHLQGVPMIVGLRVKLNIKTTKAARWSSPLPSRFKTTISCSVRGNNLISVLCHAYLYRLLFCMLNSFYSNAYIYHSSSSAMQTACTAGSTGDAAECPSHHSKATVYWRIYCSSPNQVCRFGCWFTYVLNFLIFSIQLCMTDEDPKIHNNTYGKIDWVYMNHRSYDSRM